MTNEERELRERVKEAIRKAFSDKSIRELLRKAMGKATREHTRQQREFNSPAACRARKQQELIAKLEAHAASARKIGNVHEAAAFEAKATELRRKLHRKRRK